MASCLEWNPPPALRRSHALLRDMQKIEANTFLPIHTDIPDLSRRVLKSRHPPWKTGEHLRAEGFSIINAWKETLVAGTAPYFEELLSPGGKPPGSDLPRNIWSMLNRIRTKHGRCRSLLFKWGKLESAECDCGAPDQTVLHIVQDCSLRAYRGEFVDFLRATPEAVAYISNLDVQL
jgi:hypothetical protein